MAFRMLSDILSRGAVHNYHITKGGSTIANDAFVCSSVMG